MTNINFLPHEVSRDILVDFNLKKCSYCKEIKATDQFYVNCQAKDGLQTQCKSCVAQLRKPITEEQKLKAKIRYDLNKEHISLKSKEWRTENKDKIKTKLEETVCQRRPINRERAKKYREQDKYKQYNKNYYRNNKKRYKNTHNITSIRTLKENVIQKYFNINLEEFKTYIQSQWLEYMNWDNYQVDWTISLNTEEVKLENIYVKSKIKMC